MQQPKVKYISLHQAVQLRLVPWALGRHSLTELFQENHIKNIRRGTAKRPRYFTTKEWIYEYIAKHTP